MANFDLSFEKLMKLEFSNDKNALHKNQGETGLTFMGIYESANPKWQGWAKIKTLVNMYQNLEIVSQICYKDSDLKQAVKDFYKSNYWDKMQGDKILPYDTANLIFIFGVNVGMKTAIKKAQEIVKVENDGIIGKITLNALNAYSPLKFIYEYKQSQIKYYETLARLKPQYRQFLRGWLNRVKNS